MKIYTGREGKIVLAFRGNSLSENNHILSICWLTILPFILDACCLYRFIVRSKKLEAFIQSAENLKSSVLLKEVLRIVTFPFYNGTGQLMKLHQISGLLANIVSQHMSNILP